ncbi:MAG: serine--tRNA ligase [Parcubacteria group bacterium CG11_big_fil_rev_8_21_14_0_20_39_14]|nr:MAG: serine--tRNA ligase [Parcubacteria group bacterium CG11_big_fil_rev_8_21_14_0_20_39_14]PIS35056.1 MAG: serine--tRNA ligase [Parcubacteria group bacterium CG08_land_8_20_14_0_20_38_56]
MLDIKFIREYPDKVKEGCRKKRVDVEIDKLLEADRKRREVLQALEQILAQKNKASKIIASTKDENERKKLILQMQELDKNNDRLSKEFKKFEEEFNSLMQKIPNLPFDDAPEGKNENDNVVLREMVEKPTFDFRPSDYLEIAEKLDLIDVKRATKVSGSRFGYLKREGVLLEFALINFVFDTLLKKGFIPIIPPVMLKPEMLEKTGHLSEKDRPERYFIEKDNLYLAGTAEQPIGAMHADEIFDEKDLPRRYLGFSTCFRREAGAYGKDTRGILRVHQFDKIEMFSFCHPERTREEHQFFLSCEEKIMQLLKIPYRVVQICAGDLGFPAAAAYDIEAWLPSEGRFRETHSTFNDTDFQTRRLNIRYRRAKDKKLEFTCALNGTALAIGRAIIAIIENYQEKDGGVRIPEVLQKYMKIEKIDSKKSKI